MAIYYVRSGGDIGSFTGSYASLSALQTAIGTFTSSDTVYVASDHLNTAYGANFTLSCPSSGAGFKIISVNTSTLDLEAGAVERTGAFFYGVDGWGDFWGIEFQSGSGGTGTHNLSINTLSTGDSIQTYTQCKLTLMSTGSASVLSIGVVGALQNRTLLRNCLVGFSHILQKVSVRSFQEWYSCGINSSKTSPTSLFSSGASAGSYTFSACDFSLVTNLWNVAGDDTPQYALFVNCLLPSNITTGTHPGYGGNVVECQGYGTSADDHNYHYYYENGVGKIVDDSGVYLTTGGASFKDTNGSSIPLSLRVISSASVTNTTPLVTPWFNVEVTSIGNKTFSVKIANTVAALKDTEVWLELEYMADSANPMTTNVIDAPVVSGTNSLNILAAGTNRTDTAEAWTGITGEVTHTLSKTVTVNQIGWARARVCLAKASTTIYVDPKVRIS